MYIYIYIYTPQRAGLVGEAGVDVDDPAREAAARRRADAAQVGAFL